MTTVALSQGQTYWFTPETFGFPPGATLEEYRNYYIQFYPNPDPPDEGYDAYFAFNGEDWNYNHYPLIWFGDITFYGLRATTSNVTGILYRFKYKIIRRTYDQIVIDSNEEGPASSYPSVIEVDIATSNPGFVPVGLSIGISNLSHTWFSDLYIMLRSPSGFGVGLVCGNLGSNPYTAQSFTFKDGGTDIALAPQGSLSGPYRARTLAELNNYSIDLSEIDEVFGIYIAYPVELINSTLGGLIDGLWTLYVYDVFSADGGTIGDWSLIFRDALSNEITYTTEKGLPVTTGEFEYLYYIVTDINSPPENQLGFPAVEDLKCAVGKTLALRFNIYDPEVYTSGALLDTTLSVSAGTLQLVNTNSALMSGNNTNQLVLQGVINNYYAPNSIPALLDNYPNLYFVSPTPAPPSITLTVTTSDNGVAGIGGPQTTTTSFVITTIYPMPPVGIPFSVYAIGQVPTPIYPESFSINDTSADGYLSSIYAIAVHTLPAAGVIKLGSAPIQVGQTITIAEMQSSGLVYESPLSVTEDMIFTFAYTVINDIDTNLLGGTNTATSPTFSTIYYYPLYVTPPILPPTQNTKEGQGVTFPASSLGYEEYQDLADEFDRFEILSLPTIGQITCGLENGLAGIEYLTAGASLSYQPPENVLTSFSESFTVRFYPNPNRLTINLDTGFVGSSINFAYIGGVMATTGSPSGIAINTNAQSFSNLTTSLKTIKYDGIYYTTGYIRSPSGSGCLLYYRNMYDIAYNSTDFRDVTFDDEATSYLPTFVNISSSQTPSGTYKPSPKTTTQSEWSQWPGGPISATLGSLTGVSPAGIWRLYTDILDLQYFWNSGSIYSWKLAFTVPRPGTATFVDVEFSVNVEPEDNRPRVISSTLIECLEETETAVTGVSLYDPDSYSPTVSIKIECLNGVLRFADFSQTTLTGNNTDTLTIAGNYQDVKNKIELQNNLLYTGDPSFIGRDVITFTVTSPAPSDPLLLSTRITRTLVVIRTAKIINTPLLSPTVVSHDKAIDTAIAIYWNDPRTNGSYWLEGELVSASPKTVPDFEGQLISYLTYQNNAYHVSLLCGHNAGTGLQWYEVRTNGTAPNTSVDTRTGGAWDPYWATNCNPPWICD
jgi:subtilisin-like proprotein convertase family protein